MNARPGVRQRAVLIAPFAPDHPAENLGAYQKITTVIGLLGRLGYDVHVLDSSHTAPTFARAILGAATEVRNQTVTLWRPARIPHRAAGKLLNWLAPSSVLSRLEGLRPELVWLYNSYAFEGRVGIALQKRTGARLVLELEDLPLARARRWSPKPRLDHWYFRRLLTSADAVTYVNARLQQDFPPDHGASLLFPSILDAALCAATAPARFGSPMRRLGYFGGLDVEKGCGVLLNAVPRLAPRWRLVVTGAGPLEAEFRDAARRFPDRVEFHGRVGRADLLRLMLGSDAIVNPHAPIAGMHDGVFPFKVCEALASGALLITTRLPPVGLPLERSVLEYDGSVTGLLAALEAAPARYHEAEAEIATLRQSLMGMYSEDALYERLRLLLGRHVNAAGSEIAPHGD